jgi:hypothetical protein
MRHHVLAFCALWLPLGAGVGAFVASGAPARAQANEPATQGDRGAGDLLSKVQRVAPTKESLAQLVRELGSDDWATRDNATKQLAVSELPLASLEELLRTQGLSPEQRTRLESVGFVAFASSDRGALGVSFSPLQGRDGVTIGRREPGFDSARVLRTGDIMLRIDGSLVQDLPDVREHVVTKDPGEFVKLDIIRDGEEQQLLVRLGSFRSLVNTQPITSDVLRLAWDRRVRRVMQATPAEAALVRVPALGQGENNVQPVLVSYEGNDWRNARNAGSPRPVPQAPRAMAGGSKAAPTREATKLFRLNVAGDAGEPQERADGAIKHLRDQVRTWESQRNKLLERLQQPNLADADRDRLKTAISQVEFSLAEVQKQIVMLEEELGVQDVGRANEEP